MKRVLLGIGLLGICSLISCTNEKKETTLFSSISPESSGIEFSNDLKEDEQFNIIQYLYFYNGGGVACGDINNDGLIDVYFSSNQNSNKLYINKGNFEFEDITEKSGTGGVGNWKTGVTMADVNGDGFLDIYVCGVGRYKGFNTSNQLLINNGDLTFTEKTEEFGLNFTGRSTQAVFFDYDLDGDLDCYLLNHSIHSANSYVTISNRLVSDSLNGDQFFRNELIQNNVENGSAKFINITKQSGIYSSRLGYGLGIGVSDINQDGYPDIYVSNDFQENDYLYINNRDGTFRQTMEKSMAHTSRFSMGVDIGDINNDAREDVMTVDMLPRNESVIKTSAGEDAYEVYKFKLKYGYHYQMARNALQLNRVISDSLVLFSDVAAQAGLEATDWSWSPLMADFDNDGLKDIFISNGILRRPNDMDYINFISNNAVQQSAKDLDIMKAMPDGKVSDFVFKNSDGLHFEDKSKEWGLDRPSLSNGAAYADFDNDGDLDLVINNLNDKAHLYRNTSDTLSSFIKIKFEGEKSNKYGLGAKVLIHANGNKFFQEVSSTRGFLSASDSRVNVGLGRIKSIDSLIIIWPGGAFQKLVDVKSNQTIVAKEINGRGKFNYRLFRAGETLLSPLTNKEVPAFRHIEDDFNAFNNEGLIPHMLTTQGPTMAKGDVNGDGLQDVFIGGGKDQTSAIFVQSEAGGWKELNSPDFKMDAPAEDTASALFDADGDGDIDLMVASGGQNPSIKPEDLRVRFYRNDGKGKFSKDEEASPKIILNASCIKPYDFDLDGDMDVFLGASVIPFLYGLSPISHLLINDGRGNFFPSKDWLGQSKFDNPTVVRPGMVNDAAWTDVNADGRPDLIVVGEWMPITILIQNEVHQFDNRSNEYGLAETHGWWNSITAFDADHDGDDDYVVGNLGHNSRLRASPKEPVKLHLGDFDSNGGSDHILVYYNDGKSYPFASRDQLVKQMPGLKKKFLKYIDYRNVNLEDIITPKQKGNSAEMKAEIFSSSFIKNDKGKLVITDLPAGSQIAPVFSIAVEDINNDSHPDMILCGNLLATQPDFGRYDASIGVILLGDGTGKWHPMDAMKSGLAIQGEIRDIQIVTDRQKKKKILFARNNESIRGYSVK